MVESVCFFVKNIDELKVLQQMVVSGKINKKYTFIFFWNDSLKELGNKLGIKSYIFQDIEKKIDFVPIKEKLLNHLSLFPHKKILENKSLIELLEYEGQSLWWFVRQGIFGHFMDVVRQIVVIDLFLKQKKPKKIIIFNDDYQIYQSFLNLKKKHKFSLEMVSHTAKNQKPAIWKSTKKSLELLPRAIRVSQGFFRDLRTRKNKNGTIKNILFFTQAHVWTTLSEGLKGDTNSYTIMHQMINEKKLGKTTYNIIPIDIGINNKACWKGIKEKKFPFLPYEYFIFRSFFNFKLRKKLYIQNKKLIYIWSRLKTNQAFKNSTKFEQIDLFNICKITFQGYFLDNFGSFIGAARNIEISKIILKKYLIDASICIDENGSSRFLVFASNKTGVPSIGLQHGIIHPYHVSYHYSKSDFDSYGGGLDCIFADRTAVFGSHFKKLLSEYGNYPASSIAVTGQPRTDIIFENEKKYSKKLLCKKLGINPQKSIIVFASGPLKNVAEMPTALSAIVNSIKKLENVQFVIKLHPNDNWEFYSNEMKKLNFKCVITKTTDLYNLLFSSSLVISVNSTVILDALLLKKPVIQLNLLESYDVFSNLKNRAFIQVRKKEELVKEIKKILNNKRKIFFKKSSELFRCGYYMPIDGKATQRFINVFEDVLKDNKKQK